MALLLLTGVGYLDELIRARSPTRTRFRFRSSGLLPIRRRSGIRIHGHSGRLRFRQYTASSSPLTTTAPKVTGGMMLQALAPAK